MDNFEKDLQNIKKLTAKIGGLKHLTRKAVLLDFAKIVISSQKTILQANVKDLKLLPPTKDAAFRERLSLDSKKIMDVALGIKQVALMPDPLGKILEVKNLPNRLLLKKVSVPLGVVGVIYESRPNVTADLATLALKTGNAIVLKGGKESFYSSQAFISLLHKVFKKHGIPKLCAYLVSQKSDWRKSLLEAVGTVDVLIPRGGKELINFVRAHSRVPVIETGAGVCHIFVDEKYNPKTASDIIVNAKTQRPSVCNSLDTLVAHKNTLKSLLPQLALRLKDWQVEIRADAPGYKILKNIYPGQLLKKAVPADFGKEFLSLVMAIKTVRNFKQGLEFIQTYTSGHSEAILTGNKKHASLFLQNVDAAAVYHNASIRFTDGGEFGMGAEVGVSTQKLHARGPMGLEALTSYKWLIYGKGQVRP